MASVMPLRKSQRTPNSWAARTLPSRPMGRQETGETGVLGALRLPPPGPVGTLQPLRARAASRPGLHSPAGGHGRGGGEVGGVGAGRAGSRGPRRRADGVASARGRGWRRCAVEIGQVQRAGHEATVAGPVQQPLSAAAVVQQLVHDHAPGLGARGPRLLRHRLVARGCLLAVALALTDSGTDRREDGAGTGAARGCPAI